MKSLLCTTLFATAVLSGCKDDPPALPAEAVQNVRAQFVATGGDTPTDADSDVAVPRTVYRQAAEKARKTITLESAKQYLENMDAQIEQEREMSR
jgi:hypothetical protein